MLSKKELDVYRKQLERDADQWAVLFSALGDVRRIQIMLLLIRNSEVCVTDIANLFGITVSAASQQLKLMELSGLIQRERQGQMICFKTREKDKRIKGLLSLLKANY